MRLLHVEPSPPGGELLINLEEHFGEPPKYAILSHRWGAPNEEVLFGDFDGTGDAARGKAAYDKVKNCCQQALDYGLEYVWIDTCCIDKSSSAELSEALNSMYAWYHDAQICFVYLHDVPGNENPRAETAAFRRSSWFSRGWTLQELVAPVELIFFSRDWNARQCGTRSSLSDVISDITLIPRHILIDRDAVDTASVAQKMSWASGRQTTRVEDEAYSLIGLFKVSMSTIYGEGKRAFLRLQEEIMLRSTDHSLFAWDASSDEVQAVGMLASSPRSFANSAGYEPMELNEFIRRFSGQLGSDPGHDYTQLIDNLQPSYSMSNFGLNIQLPTVAMSSHYPRHRAAFLACTHGPDKRSTVIFLEKRTDRPEGHFVRTCFNSQATVHHPADSHPSATLLLTRPLWIAGLGSQAQQGHVKTPKEPHAYSSKLVVRFAMRTASKLFDYYPRGEYKGLIPGLITNQSYEIEIAQGDHVVIMSPTARDSYGLVTLGLQNGKAWYHFEGPFKEPRALPSDLKIAERAHGEYDILSGGRYWQLHASELKFFVDDAKSLVMSPRSHWVNSTNQRKCIVWAQSPDQSGQMTEYVSLGYKWAEGSFILTYQ